MLKAQSRHLYFLIILCATISCSKVQENKIVEGEVNIDSVNVFKSELSISQKSILNTNRIALTKSYVKSHYGLSDINFKPRGIVIHYTALPDLKSSFNVFKKDTISTRRKYVAKFGLLNVGVQYLIDTNGNIFQLLPDTIIGRHTIGFNSSCIGIENVGVEGDDLTEKQLESNCTLISHICNRYRDIEYLFGHHEYMIDSLPHYKLYHELDTTYQPTVKVDPGEQFMLELRYCLNKRGVDLLK